ncbi:MAG: asparagine synthase (glutamine-hydrolyzing) [Bacteroidota bacterium]
MCGISGIAAFNEKGKDFLGRIDAAVKSMHLRGPDQNGIMHHGNVALGHNRLSIIDVSEAASQPFSDSTGRYTIVFNGEFFNFQEHREQLLQSGIKLRSTSDTEVLLYLYIREGAACLQKINGFFAFAIYDRNDGSLFIARDRMGVKPLLIYSDSDKIIFASEMKALIATGIPRKMDMASVQAYLHLNYIPAPQSIFEGVRKLRPGSYLIVKDGTVAEKEFYSIPFYDERESRPCDSYETAQKKIVELLDASVQRRLISDVPLGAFLSGGVDSSVIVALASRHTKNLNTFSIGFRDEPFFDETRYAEMVAKMYNTNHTAFSLTTDDMFGVLHGVLDYIDEPFADSSAIAVNILSMHTRKHVTVALSGDGADELYGGYMKHSGEWRVRNAGNAAKLIGALGPLWKTLPKSRNSAFSNRARQLDKFASGLNMDAKSRYWRWAGFLPDDDSPLLLKNLHDTTTLQSRKGKILENIIEGKNMNSVLHTDMHLVLQNDMLTKVDLMSMANSLEVRTPFLDFEHVNYVAGLPSSYKIQGTQRKKILQDAFRELLPQEIYNRPKHGFEVPLLKWFRGGLSSMIEQDLLNDDFIQDQKIFDITETKKIKSRLHSQNPGDAHAQIWGLLVFQYWWKKYMS